jgi:predicted nucleic acid-binding protein
MAIRTHYLDTSAIVKLLFEEDGSKTLRQYRNTHTVFYTTSLRFAETLGVIKARYVRKDISHETYLRVCHRFMMDITNRNIAIEEISITTQPVHQCVEKYAESYGLDISDAFQLYTLKESFVKSFGGDSKTILITADEALAEAARKENLRVWDCLREDPP